jgi:hypothetical protein
MTGRRCCTSAEHVGPPSSSGLAAFLVLPVTGDTADFTATVTKSTGTFLAEGITPNQETAWEVRDLGNGTPPTDEINVNPLPYGSGPAPCTFTAKPTPGTFTIDHGNITVNDNE